MYFILVHDVQHDDNSPIVLCKVNIQVLNTNRLIDYQHEMLAINAIGNCTYEKYHKTKSHFKPILFCIMLTIYQQYFFKRHM